MAFPLSLKPKQPAEKTFGQSDYFLYTNWFYLFIELNELPGCFVTVGTQLNPLRVRYLCLVNYGAIETFIIIIIFWWFFMGESGYFSQASPSGPQTTLVIL